MQLASKTFISSLIFCLSSLALITAAHAQIYTTPPALPGFTHSDELDIDTPEQQGVILDGRQVTYSSPVIAEVDGDPSNGKEAVAAGADGVVYVYSSTGNLLWSANTPNSTCVGVGADNKILSGAAVGELFGDGIPYVVIGYGGIGGRKCDGGVIAFKGADGSVKWNFSLKKFSKKEHFFAFSYSVFSSPGLADTDGDGKMEIGFGAFDRNIYLLNADGTVRWYYSAADTVWSSPAFADVDGDGKLEMIIGSDISGNSIIRPPTTNGGYLYAFKTKRRKFKHINFRDADAYLWMTSFDQTIYASPVIADILPANAGKEVIIGAGCFFPQDTSAKSGAWFKILSLKTGAVLQTLDITACSPSAIAVGDLNDDGILDIAANVNGAKAVGGDGVSRIMAWSPALSSDPLWSIVPYDRGHNDGYGGNFMSPVIADIDGNGSLEVIAGTYGAVGIFNGADGSALTCQTRNCDSDTPTLLAWRVMHTTPAVGDINGDGVLDVVAAGGHSGAPDNGALYAWTGLKGLIQSPKGNQTPYAAPWPMWRGNAQHLGAIE